MALKHRLKASVTGAYGQVPGNPMVHRRPQDRFTPTNVQPPPGSYDPSLDAALGRTNRGYGDLLADYAPADGSMGTPGRLTGRAQDDYRLGIDRITGESGSYTRSLSDLLRDRARATEDFQTQRTNAQTGADRQLQDTSRSFANLKAQQSDVYNATGQSEGGAALQGQEKRAANQGLIDTRTHEDLSRALTAIQTNADRFGSDSSTAETRLGQNKDMALGDLGLGYQRSVDDATTTVARAGRENTFFGQDTQAQKIAQAKGQGWTAPHRPANEHTDAHGAFRVVKVRGRNVKIRPDGTVEAM
jgi:hypothetical protein